MFRFLFLSISLIACSQNHVINIKKDTVGQITTTELFKLKSDWKESFEAYNVVEKTKIDQDIEVTIITALWCHDSEREIPVLLKVLKEYSFKENQIKLILTDKKKRKPEKVIKENKVFFTPTIIFKKDGIELKRFVENPNTYWERDIKRLAVKAAEND